MVDNENCCIMYDVNIFEKFVIIESKMVDALNHRSSYSYSPWR